MFFFLLLETKSIALFYLFDVIKVDQRSRQVGTKSVVHDNHEDAKSSGSVENAQGRI